MQLKVCFPCLHFEINSDQFSNVIIAIFSFWQFYCRLMLFSMNFFVFLAFAFKFPYMFRKACAGVTIGNGCLLCVVFPVCILSLCVFFIYTHTQSPPSVFYIQQFSIRKYMVRWLEIRTNLSFPWMSLFLKQVFSTID